MTTIRRELLKGAAAGSSWLTLRALATGLPISVLQNAHAIPSPEALEAEQDAPPPQFLIINMSSMGDAINCSTPGIFDNAGEPVFPGVHVNQQESMKATQISVGGELHYAAAPWAKLSTQTLDRTSFIHHSTRTNIHAQYESVMTLQGSSRGPNGETSFPDYLPSIVSSAMQDRLDTITDRPVNFSAPRLKFQQKSVNKARPSTLKKIFTVLSGNDALARKQRDVDLKRINEILKQNGTASQRAWLDQHSRSLDETRQLNETALAKFESLTNNSLASQIDAALILFELKMTAVACVYISFSGDNHEDGGLGEEAKLHSSGVDNLNMMFNKIDDKGMRDKVTYCNLGVFGRTLSKIRGGDGRDHNRDHHVTMLTGVNVKPSVVGGLAPNFGDFKAENFDPETGAMSSGGKVGDSNSLESMAKTVCAACGAHDADINKRIKARGPNGDTDHGFKIQASLV